MTAEQLRIPTPAVEDGRNDDVPADQAARDRIADDLDHTLFVEAGAGSGKTRALVDRIIALIEAGTQLEHIAAITFTEKAANELRERVRRRIAALVQTQSGRGTWSEALGQLDGAAISTLHSFAQRLLFEHPIEAGLPPGVEVLDELESQIDFDERWDDFVPDLLTNPQHAAALLLADVLNISIADLRVLAIQLEANWDLALERPPEAQPLTDIDVAPVLTAVRDLASHLDGCRDHTDRLAERLVEVDEYADRLEAIAGSSHADPVDRLVDLVETLSQDDPAFTTRNGGLHTRLGARRAWHEPELLDAARLALFEAGQIRAALLNDVTAQVIGLLAVELTAFVAVSVDARRRDGRLRFHDLLVMAREMLRHPDHGDGVRAAVSDRYRHLLIDEFQDTDPVQIELATLIAAEPGSDPRSDWKTIPTSPGRLFFVGDPKQSIYRFRRADIGVYLECQAHFGGDKNLLRLSTNFRSSLPVIDWVNQVFASIIRHEPGSQPHYVPLDPHRGTPLIGPGVIALGKGPHPKGTRADDLRRAEAGEVAGIVAEAVETGWTVHDRDADGNEAHRQATLGDITILLPSRTSLPALERALEAASIPYRAETASLVYSTPEVRTLVLVARAIDDPTDELAVVAALRSAAFGCGDDDLLRYRRELKGTWNHQALSDSLPVGDIVVDGLKWMSEAHGLRGWASPSQTLDRIVRERRLLELGVVDDRHREVWRRLRFVVDQARAWTESRGGSLREYLGWVRLQASDSARVAESVLPETDTDAVRIMTVHAAKGLEFPITIVSGLTTRMSGPRRGVSVVWPPDGPPGIHIRSNRSTPEYEAFKPIDEQLDAHERLRLLYVACTRAQDHLVVSLHRSEGGSGSTLAELLAGNGGDQASGPERPQRPLAVTAPQALPEPVSPAEWERRRSAVFDTATRSHTIAATTLARVAAEVRSDSGLAKEPRNLDLPPWQKGRYGTAVGRSVHGLLQAIDLGGGDDLSAAARAQAAAEGILGREDVVEALAASALASEVVREAAAAEFWRELFVAAPLGDRLLEGYVDLVFRRGNGLVVVDYKTDAWADDEDLDAKVERYRIQIAAYARAIETTTALPVVDAILLFVGPDRAVPRSIPDLRQVMAALDDLVDQVRAGGEAVVED